MIVLKKLILKDFMSIDDASIDFIKGPVLISGPNGTGKSAPIDAIAICLTEYRRSDTFLDYIQKGTDKTSAYIKLWAEFNGEELFFDISINKEKGNTFQRSITYKNKVYQMAEASELIRTLDLSYYSNIILAMQDSEDITKLSPTQRANYLQKLLNFDFSNYIAIVDNEIKTCEGNKHHLDSQILFQKNEIITRQNEIKKNEQLPYTQEEYKTFIDRKNAISESMIVEHNKILESADLVNQKTQLITQRLDLEKQIETIKSAQKNMTQYEADYKKLTASSIEANKQIQSIQDKLLDLKDLYSKTIEANKELTEQVNQYERSFAVMSEQLKTADKMVELAKKGMCPECGQTTDNIDLEQWQQKRSKLLLDRESVNSSIKTIQDSIRENIRVIDVNGPEITKLERQFAVASSNSRRFATELVNLKKPDEVTDNTIDLTTQISIIRDSLAIIEEKLAVEKNHSETISKLKTEELDLFHKISAYEKTIQQNVFISTHNQEVAEAIQVLETKIEDQKKLIVEINKRLALLNEAKTILDKKLSNYLIVKTCATLESEMNQFIQIVFPLMEVRLYQNKKGVEFFYTTDKTKINDKTSKNDLINVKMASGFQKELLSIAFRVALCKAYNLSLLILDECDKAADAEASEKLFDTLLNESNFEQMLIITHKPSVKEMILAIAPIYKMYTPQSGVFFECE